MKQTAMEWLKEQLETYGDPQYCELKWEELDSLINQAKEMEKEQIVDAWMDGMEGILHKIAAEKYYNETYGKQ